MWKVDMELGAQILWSSPRERVGKHNSTGGLGDA